MDIDNQTLQPNYSLLLLLSSLQQLENQTNNDHLQPPQSDCQAQLTSFMQQAQLIQAISQLANTQQTLPNQSSQLPSSPIVSEEDEENFVNEQKETLNSKNLSALNIVTSSSSSSTSPETVGTGSLPMIRTPNHTGFFSSNQEEKNNETQPNQIELLRILQSCLNLEQLIQSNAQNIKLENNEEIQEEFVPSEQNQYENAQLLKFAHLLQTPSQETKENKSEETAQNKNSAQDLAFLLNGANEQHILSSDNSDFQSTDKKYISFSKPGAFAPRVISYNNAGNVDNSRNQLEQIETTLFNQVDQATAFALSTLFAQHERAAIAAVAAMGISDAIRVREQKRLERKLKIEKYKNKRRNWIRKISYDCRKRVADSRLRVKGRFISKKDSEKLKTREDSSFPQENNQGYDQFNSSYCNNEGLERPTKNRKSMKSQLQQNQYQNLKDSVKMNYEETGQLLGSQNDLMGASYQDARQINLKPEYMVKLKERISKKLPLFNLHVVPSKSVLVKQESSSLPLASFITEMQVKEEEETNIKA